MLAFTGLELKGRVIIPSNPRDDVGSRILRSHVSIIAVVTAIIDAGGNLLVHRFREVEYALATKQQDLPLPERGVLLRHMLLNFCSSGRQTRRRAGEWD
jgi:hypothetical protein